MFYELFYTTASATVYGQRPKFFRAEHSATAEGENCAYGPTLQKFVVNAQQCCLYTSSKLSRPYFEFSLKVKVMGSNPGYLLKSFLLYVYKAALLENFTTFLLYTIH